MRTANLGLYALSAVVLLAGCAPQKILSELPPTAVGGAVPGTRYPIHRSSWMAPDAAKNVLVYVSNGNGIVNVYRYSKHTLIGELTNFTDPKGECTDRSGNVYIADYAAETISEYAHGGTTALRTIDTSPYRPYGCAINLKNGDLAVADYSQSDSYSLGTLAVYARAKGKPTYYSNRDLYHVNACAYDKYGDLLVAGFDLYSSEYLETSFAYLPAKSTDYQEIALPAPGTSSYWYAVEVRGMGWDGQYWIVEAYDRLYQYSIDIKPEWIGTVEIRGNSSPVAFYFPNRKKPATRVIGAFTSQTEPHLYYWEYPAGGEPYVSITHGLDLPFGVALSAAK